MTYFEQLKDQYSDPKEAYRDYTLSKTILRVFACHDKAPDDIKIAMELQKKLNEFSQNLIKDKYTNFKKIFNIADGEEVSFIKKNIDIFNFLGINRQMFINLITEGYNNQLYEASKNISWDSLEQIIISENNNKPILNEEESIRILKDTCEEYAVSSINYGKIRTTIDSLNNTNESLNQLHLVMGCPKQHIGAQKFNLFFDTEEIQYAGYSIQYNNEQKLFLNERISYDAFAHEWLHSVDNMIAKDRKLNALHASESLDDGKNNIQQLLYETMLPNKKVIESFKYNVTEKTFITLSNTIDRFEKLGFLERTDELKEYVINFAKKVSNDKTFWNPENKKNFHKYIMTYTKNDTLNAYSSFLATEIELLHQLKHGKDFNESIFYRYAIEMDKSLIDIGFLEKTDTYSITKCEMFARAFETYCQIQLNKKNVKNIISDENTNTYTPRKEEMNEYLRAWDNVIEDMKEVLQKVYPITDIPNNERNLLQTNVLNNIKDMRDKAIKSQISLQINKL